MKAASTYRSRTVTAMCRVAAVVGALVLVAGCGEPVDSQLGLGFGPTPEFPHPVVDRDLARIREAGVLRMITFYDSSSYFVHKGGQAGFDYELLQRFAREHNLTVEVVVPRNGEDVVSLLNSGRGDVICPGRPPEADWLRWSRVTRPTNFVRMTVILPADSDRSLSLHALDDLVVTLPAGDPFRDELLEIAGRENLSIRVQMSLAGTSAEDILAAVRRGETDATVVADALAQAAVLHAPGLKLGPRLGEVRPAAWLVRENCPALLDALNSYLKDHLQVSASGRSRRSRTYGIIYNRYFQDVVTVRDFRVPAHRPDKSGILSPYDDLVRPMAETAGLDWRLVVSLIYQESRFNPQARSRADARGLMQVLPRVAGAQADSLYDTGANVRAGLRLLRRSWRSYAYLDSLDRVRFTLADYHAGVGHVTDARRLAMDLGRNPNHWDGALAETLPLLTREPYHAATRHGYYGGDKTVAYVQEILARYRAYARLVPRASPPVEDETPRLLVPLFATRPPRPGAPR